MPSSGRGTRYEQGQWERAHIRPRQRDLLPLAAGEVHTAGKPPAELLLETILETACYGVGETPFRSGFDPIDVGHSVDLADPDVFLEQERVSNEVLEDDADVGTKFV